MLLSNQKWPVYDRLICPICVTSILLNFMKVIKGIKYGEYCIMWSNHSLTKYISSFFLRICRVCILKRHPNNERTKVDRFIHYFPPL